MQAALQESGTNTWTLAGGWMLSAAPEVNAEALEIARPGFNTKHWMPAYPVLALYAGRGFDRGVLNGGTTEGIAIKGTKTGTVSIDRVAMGETDIREPMTRIVNGEARSRAVLNGI